MPAASGKGAESPRCPHTSGLRARHPVEAALRYWEWGSRGWQEVFGPHGKHSQHRINSTYSSAKGPSLLYGPVMDIPPHTP